MGQSPNHHLKVFCGSQKHHTECVVFFLMLLSITEDISVFHVINACIEKMGGIEHMISLWLQSLE